MQFTIIICFILGLQTSLLWGDDIWFILPLPGQPVTGDLTIKIYPPTEETPIHLWIEEDYSERLVWSATVYPSDNYTITLDTTKLNSGKHEINALYYLYGLEYEGDIDIEINSP